MAEEKDRKQIVEEQFWVRRLVLGSESPHGTAVNDRAIAPFAVGASESRDATNGWIKDVASPKIQLHPGTELRHESGKWTKLPTLYMNLWVPYHPTRRFTTPHHGLCTIFSAFSSCQEARRIAIGSMVPPFCCSDLSFPQITGHLGLAPRSAGITIPSPFLLLCSIPEK